MKELPKYIFICPVCNIILDTDELIEQHSEHCNSVENSCKYYNEEVLVEYVNDKIKKDTKRNN